MICQAAHCEFAARLVWLHTRLCAINCSTVEDGQVGSAGAPSRSRKEPRTLQLAASLGSVYILTCAINCKYCRMRTTEFGNCIPEQISCHAPHAVKHSELEPRKELRYSSTRNSVMSWLAAACVVECGQQSSETVSRNKFLAMSLTR